MFEFNEIVTHPKYYLHYTRPCIIIALTISTIIKITKKPQNRQKQINFYGEMYKLKKALSNNFKLQSDKTLTTKACFFLIKKQIRFFLTTLGDNSTKRENNEAKRKSKSTFYKTK